MDFAHRTYTAASKFKAAKPFTMNGTNYTFDDPVDVTGIEERRIRLMFEARLIEVDNRDANARKRHASDQKAQREAEKVTEGKRSGLVARHEGFGRWYVFDEQDNKLAGPFKGEKAQVEAEAALAGMQ